MTMGHQLNTSNPFSTGGGGTTFERRIAASYMVAVLHQDIPRGLTGGAATSVRLQARQTGAPLDDILVTSYDDQAIRHLQMQVKHGLAFTEKSAEFQEVIGSCWAAFRSRHGFSFDPAFDRLAIAVPHLPGYVRKDLLGLLDWARGCLSSVEFFQKTSGIAAKQKFADLIRQRVQAIEHPGDDDMWAFLRCLTVMEFDLDHDGSGCASDAWNRLLDLTPDHSPAQAISLFDVLIAESDRLAPIAGTIDKQGLYLAIRQRYPEFRLQPAIDDQLIDDIQKISAVFVPPAQYDDAALKLRTRGLVVLHGPPHCGKTATAIRLAMMLKEEDASRSMIRFGSGDEVDERHLFPNSIVLLDDYYGRVHLENPAQAGEYADLERLARHHSVIVTTRASVLAEAKQRTRLAEEKGFDDNIISLTQEGSYNDAALLEILRKHLDYMRHNIVPQADRLTDMQAKTAWDERYRIVRELRFPHNIERLCRIHLPALGMQSDLAEAIEKAKHIEEAAKAWVESRPDGEKWFVFLLALFPATDKGILSVIYRQVASRFRFPVDDPSNLAAKTSAYVSGGPRPVLGHPSYRDAILSLMRERYESLATEVADLGLEEIARTDTLALGRCAAADYGWVRYAPGQSVDIVNYLGRLMSTYNMIRDRVVPQLRQRLAPYTEDAACLFLEYPDHSGGELMMVPPGEDANQLYIETPSDVSVRLDEIREQAFEAMQELAVYSVDARDLARRSPHLHALDIVRRNMKHVFEKQRLDEAWPVVYLRLQKYLSDSTFRMAGLDLDPRMPFGDQEMQALSDSIVKVLSQPVPPDWRPDAWERNKQRLSHLYLAIDLCVGALARQERIYTGKLLAQPDIVGEGMAVCSSYSAKCMEALIRRGLDLVFESYEWMINANFGSIRDHVVRVRRMPIHVVGAVAYRDSVWEAKSRFFLLPSTFPILNGGNYEIYVSVEHDGQNGNKPAFPTDVEGRLAEIYNSHEWFEMNLVGPRRLIDPTEFIKTIYGWIQKDVNQALAWDGIGSERTHYLSEHALHFAAGNKGSLSCWDVVRYTEGFDWP